MGVVDALQDELCPGFERDEIQVLETSRIGGCGNGPEMMVYPEGPLCWYDTDDIPYLVEEHFLKEELFNKFP